MLQHVLLVYVNCALCTVHCTGSHLQIPTLHNTSLHITHQQVAEGLDHSGSQTSILAVHTHAQTHTVNSNIAVNFNQEYVKIIPDKMSVLFY